MLLSHPHYFPSKSYDIDATNIQSSGIIPIALTQSIQIYFVFY